MPEILLGFVAEGLHRGEPFYVPIAHTIITGLTQGSGKTTTEEAYLNRLPKVNPPYKALVFLTKRGEKVFANAHTVPPFYREHFDWEYVRGLLESTMKEKLKFETPWIIRICKQAERELARTEDEMFREKRKLAAGEGLTIVRKLLGVILTREKLRDFDRNIYELLAAYLDKVLPVLQEAQLSFTDKLELKPGINVMDLTPWYTHEEVQMLIIRSCMEEILKTGVNTILGAPEMWKLLPQGRNTPVKLFFEKFVREGATNGNHFLGDSQDLGGTDKTPLRQISVWIMGRMQESNEVQRLLDQMLGAKIDASVIQTLPLGHFIVAAKDKVTKVYVWPNNVPESLAKEVAMGITPPERVQAFIKAQQLEEEREREEKPLQMPLSLMQTAVGKRMDALSRRLDDMSEQFLSHLKSVDQELRSVDEEIKLLKSASIPVPGEGTLTQVKRKVTVEPAELKFKLTTETSAGKIMWIAKEGFLSSWKRQSEIADELANKHGWTFTVSPRGNTSIELTHALESLAKDGYLGKRKTDRAEYRLGEFVTFE